MTNPKKKPAPKGVPMPHDLRWFECNWQEDADGYLHPFIRRWNYDAETGGMEAERTRCEAWLDNPQQPKGVRR